MEMPAEVVQKFAAPAAEVKPVRQNSPWPTHPPQHKKASPQRQSFPQDRNKAVNLTRQGLERAGKITDEIPTPSNENVTMNNETQNVAADQTNVGAEMITPIKRPAGPDLRSSANTEGAAERHAEYERRVAEQLAALESNRDTTVAAAPENQIAWYNPDGWNFVTKVVVAGVTGAVIGWTIGTALNAIFSED
jgi:hypothetical protein